MNQNQVVSPISTFSIVGRCARTQMLGVAIASKYLAVGAVCSHTQANTGAIATQAYGNPYLGYNGLDLLAQNLSAAEALGLLLKQDEGYRKRQVIIVDRQGNTAAHTGDLASSWAGHITGHNYAIAGNILTGENVLQAMQATFEQNPDQNLAERLLSALEAGQQAGGDRRGRQAAHLQVVDTEMWKYVDLRVDDHAQPVTELRRIFELAKTDLFPFRKMYPTKANTGGDWDLTTLAQISPTMVNR